MRKTQIPKTMPIRTTHQPKAIFNDQAFHTIDVLMNLQAPHSICKMV